MEPIDLRNIFTTFTKKFDNTDQIPPSIFLRVFDNAVNNEKAIRIVTWNVYGKGGTKEFIDLYRRIDADILVLQEVDFSRDKYIIDKFKNQLGYIEHYYASISGRNDSSLGTLLLTKIPATKSYVIPLPQTQKFDSIPERSVLFTLIAGQWFISCHLDGHDKIGELRRLQVSSIFELIDEIIGPNTKKPIIWLGDFNTVRNSDYSPRHLEWQLAQARLAQARSRQKNDKNYIRDIRTIEMITSGQFTRSFGQHSEGKEEDGSHFIEVTDLIKTGGISFTTWTANRVDFIFLKNISPEQIIHFFPVVTPLSDHLPLVLDLLVSV
jgi:endonuclease/exonuclease/phosphatase family metal-dependent hydrolase